jgi:1-acyl-sn-glycerol-3-phosphate acyltransferase
VAAAATGCVDRVVVPFDWLERRLRRAHDAPVATPDTTTRQLWFGRAGAFLRWFSPSVQGIGNVPVDGPVLVVGNHSGVYFMPDVFVTSRALADRRGIGAPFHVAAYDLLFGVPVLADLLRRVGAEPADPVTAEQQLRDGDLVLVYPGGDWEACRAWSERGRVDLADHKGFVRLALRTGVPVVPVVAHGSHESVVVVNRGDRIARLLGLERLHVKVFPILVGVPWGLTTALLPPLPLPSAVTVAFLPAIDWSALGPAAAEDPEVVEACYRQVSEALQAGLDRLHAADPHPVRHGVRELLHRR